MFLRRFDLVFLRRFVAYILFSHERALQAAKQQSSCVYIHIERERKKHVCIHTQAHRLFIQGQEPSSSGWLSSESNSIN